MAANTKTIENPKRLLYISRNLPMASPLSIPTIVEIVALLEKNLPLMCIGTKSFIHDQKETFVNELEIEDIVINNIKKNSRIYEPFPKISGKMAINAHGSL